MRRSLFILLFAVAPLLVFMPPGQADHVEAVPDGLECANSPAGQTNTTTAEAGRGAVCTSDGNPANGPEYYLGGDTSAEADYPDTPEDDTGETCGALVVGGNVLAGSRPDDPATAANETLDWDWMHPHDPDGVPDTGDEFLHHHTCD